MNDLFFACLLGNFEKVKQLLVVNRINELHPTFGVTLLCFAIHSGNIPLVMYLMQQGARPFSKTNANVADNFLFWSSTIRDSEKKKALKQWWNQHAKKWIPAEQLTHLTFYTPDAFNRSMASELQVLTDVYVELRKKDSALYYCGYVEQLLRGITSPITADYRMQAVCFNTIGDLLVLGNLDQSLNSYLLAHHAMSKLVTEESKIQRVNWI